MREILMPRRFCFAACVIAAAMAIPAGFAAGPPSRAPAFTGKLTGKAPPPAEPPKLKDIYAKDFLIGAASIPTAPDTVPRELEIIKSQYNVLTPENSMKPANIHPAEDRWTWTAADALVDFCQANRIQVVGHTLVWHAQTGPWFFVGRMAVLSAANRPWPG